MIGIFGTDGVRSRINTGPMRAEYIVRLALATGEYFISKNNSFNKSSKPIVVIGKDTRLDLPQSVWIADYLVLYPLLELPI